MFGNDPKILRVKLIALGIFALISAGLTAYEFLYVQPALKCEKDGGWWSNEHRGCFAPIYLPTVTGRKPGESRQIQWPKVEDPQATATAPTKPEAATTAASVSKSRP